MVAGLLCWSPGLPGIYLRTKREERERERERELKSNRKRAYKKIRQKRFKSLPQTLIFCRTPQKFQTMNYVRPNNISLKYFRFSQSSIKGMVT